MGQLLGELVDARVAPGVELVVSIPPKPGGEDRFGPVRTEVAGAFDVPQRDDVLQMNFDVPGYKTMGPQERSDANAGRFSATARLNGEHVLLVDDVVTSGGQAGRCREQLDACGAGKVTIIGAGVTQHKLPDPCPVCGANLRTFVSEYGRFQRCSGWFVGTCNFKRNV